MTDNSNNVVQFGTIKAPKKSETAVDFFGDESMFSHNFSSSADFFNAIGIFLTQAPVETMWDGEKAVIKINGPAPVIRTDDGDINLVDLIALLKK
jgi:hypothetical protein